MASFAGTAAQFTFRRGWGSPWMVMTGYVVVMTGLSSLRLHLWMATGWDLGFYEQALWALYHQGPAAIATMAGYPVLADSGSLALIVLAPFFVWFGVGFLFVLQSAAFAFGYLLLLRIADVWGIPKTFSRWVGAAFLVYPVVVSSNLFDFHPDVLAVPLLLLAVYWSLRGRWLWYAAAVAASLVVKDMVSVAVVAMGITLLFQRKFWPGVFTLLAGVGWLVGMVDWFIPRLAHHSMSQWQAYYGYLGPNPLAGAKNLLLHPALGVAWARHLRAYEYLVWILGPMAWGLWYVRRWFSHWLWPVLAVLAVNLLSTFNAQISPFDQYSLFLVPFLFVAALDMCRAKTVRSPRPVYWIPLVAGVFLAVNLVHLRQTTWQAAPSERPILREAVARIPAKVSVAAQNFVLPQVARRNQIYDLNQLGSLWAHPPAYVLIDTRFITPNNPQSVLSGAIRTLPQHGYRWVLHRDGIWLAKRGSN